jgi:hypothetical protein
MAASVATVVLTTPRNTSPRADLPLVRDRGDLTGAGRKPPSLRNLALELAHDIAPFATLRKNFSPWRHGDRH